LVIRQALEKKGGKMDAHQLARRREELAAHAEERGFDWQAHLEGIPTDEDEIMVFVLADLLRFDFERVFDPDIKLAQLARESYRLEVQRERAKGELSRQSVAEGFSPWP
jgi:hypothetical protein